MKDLLKFGKALNKAQQKEIFGGDPRGGLSVPFIDHCEMGASSAGLACNTDSDCCPGETCSRNINYGHTGNTAPLICM